MMKVLIATPLLPTQAGGPGQYACGLEEALRARGVAVDTMSFQAVAHLPSLIRHTVLFFRALSRVYRVERVIVLDSFSMALPVVLAAFVVRRPVCVRIGGDFVWEHYVERTQKMVLLTEFYSMERHLSLKERVAFWLQKYVVVKYATGIVFSTEWQKDIWNVPYNVPHDRAHVIENRYSVAKEDAGLVAFRKRVVWCGRDLVLKNTAMLARACARLKEQCADCVYEAYSGIPHEQVLSVFRGGGVLVVPSLSEVSPNIVFEAFSVGMPVLLTEVCGLRARLGDSVTWINPRDEQDMVAKIGFCMTERGYEEAVARMRTFTHERSYDDVAREFLAHLYHEA